MSDIAINEISLTNITDDSRILRKVMIDLVDWSVFLQPFYSRLVG
jgi:hypothetical protein